MKNIDRRTALFGTITALLCSPILGSKDAKATVVTVYDEYGRQIIIDTGTLAAPVNYYTVTGAPYVVYPAAPIYAPAPIYGPAGVRGQARRVSRRTARRVSRRR